MESASAVEPASTTERRPAAHRATPHSRTSVKRAASIRTAIEPTAYISPTPEPHRMSPVIPRPRTNEDAAHKVVRPVEAVRRASVRSIVVISIRAGRRPSQIARPNPDAYSDSNLRLRIRHRNHHHRQHRQIFHVTHIHPQTQVRLVFQVIPVHLSPLVACFSVVLPSTSLYVFERSRGRKVAEIGVVDFSHLAQFQPLSADGLTYPCRDSRPRLSSRDGLCRGGLTRDKALNLSCLCR